MKASFSYFSCKALRWAYLFNAFIVSYEWWYTLKQSTAKRTCSRIS